MKNNVITLIFVSLALALTSCNRESKLKCTDANTVKVPPHAMDYFYFKVGTWWVYKCDQTGETDSLWVSDAYTEARNPYIAKKDCDCGKGHCFQEAYVKILDLHHLPSGGYNYIIYQIRRISINNWDPKTQYGSIELTESYGFNTEFPGYRMDYRENTYVNPTDNGGIITEMDSMVVHNNTFKNVMEYAYKGSGYPDWYKIAWYAKNIHLIRFIKTDGSIWNLVKYHIVQ